VAAMGESVRNPTGFPPSTSKPDIGIGAARFSPLPSTQSYRPAGWFGARREKSEFACPIIDSVANLGPPGPPFSRPGSRHRALGPDETWTVAAQVPADPPGFRPSHSLEPDLLEGDGMLHADARSGRRGELVQECRGIEVPAQSVQIGPVGAQ